MQITVRLFYHPNPKLNYLPGFQHDPHCTIPRGPPTGALFGEKKGV